MTFDRNDVVRLHVPHEPTIHGLYAAAVSLGRARAGLDSLP